MKKVNLYLFCYYNVICDIFVQILCIYFFFKVYKSLFFYLKIADFYSLFFIIRTFVALKRKTEC